MRYRIAIACYVFIFSVIFFSHFVWTLFFSCCRIFTHNLFSHVNWIAQLYEIFTIPMMHYVLKSPYFSFICYFCLNCSFGYFISKCAMCSVHSLLSGFRPYLFLYFWIFFFVIHIVHCIFTKKKIGKLSFPPSFAWPINSETTFVIHKITYLEGFSRICNAACCSSCMHMYLYVDVYGRFSDFVFIFEICFFFFFEVNTIYFRW